MFFQYDPAFLQRGISLSPYKLPAISGLCEHRDHEFGPLPGVFEDSLPDGWGRLLMDRHFRRVGLDPTTLSPLDRLAYLGARTMGALTYHPPSVVDAEAERIDLFELGRNAEEVLTGDAAEVLPQLVRAGGSPGGARPKVLVGTRGAEFRSGEGDLPAGFTPWLLKFSARADALHAGPLEYAYARMAEAAGIRIPAVRLFETGTGRSRRRHFAVERFDRLPGNGRIHAHTFANLVHANFRIPSTDYETLLRVTRALTRHRGDLLMAYRQMVFNVAAHNRDDHAKNFAFLMSESGEWRLSPAYDPTFARGPGGEHSMAVAGEGRLPARSHCLEVAASVGVPPREAVEAIEQVNAVVEAWSSFADEAAVPRKIEREVAAALRPL